MMECINVDMVYNYKCIGSVQQYNSNLGKWNIITSGNKIGLCVLLPYEVFIYSCMYYIREWSVLLPYIPVFLSRYIVMFLCSFSSQAITPHLIFYCNNGDSAHPIHPCLRVAFGPQLPDQGGENDNLKCAKSWRRTTESGRKVRLLHMCLEWMQDC